MRALMERLNMEEDVPIESRLVSRAIEGAQKKVEAHHFDIRKHLLEYDDVLNKQREVIYELRRLILAGENTRDLIADIIREQIHSLVGTFASARESQDWDAPAALDNIVYLFGSNLGFTPDSLRHTGSPLECETELNKRALALYEEREQKMGVEPLRYFERVIYLGSIDYLWKDHLLNMDHLKEGVGLRGYGQKDPLVEYKKEGFTLFKMMDERIKVDVIAKLYHLELQPPVENAPPHEEVTESDHDLLEAVYASPAASPPSRATPTSHTHATQVRNASVPTPGSQRVGRNDPCPCGSGKKYKKCHGVNS